MGHHLTAISVQLAKAEAFRERDPAAADRAVGDARRAAGRALQEVRESVGALRASSFGLTTAVAALADGLDDAGFQVSLEFSGSEEGHGRAEREALYRVAQEALTNARRHAGADLVRVALRFGPAATLEVSDNGRGFTPGEIGAGATREVSAGAAACEIDVGAATREIGGSGLLGMRERLAALGGTLLVDSAPGRGTRVTASIPAERPTIPAEPPTIAASAVPGAIGPAAAARAGGER